MTIILAIIANDGYGKAGRPAADKTAAGNTTQRTAGKRTGKQINERTTASHEIHAQIESTILHVTLKLG